jgi:hypothetical protein
MGLTSPGALARTFTRTLIFSAAACWCTAAALADDASAQPHRNDYPTYARVQYVQDCAFRAGGSQADLYKCSCVIDKLAEHLTYDQFVEASTFSHYSTLPGEGGAEFRDPDHAKEQAKLYRTLESDAYRSCGLKVPAPTR